MAKTPVSSFIIIGTDGKIAVGTNKGHVSLVSAAALKGDLVELIKKRQEAGKKLTEALAKAKFPVALASQTRIIDLREGVPKARRRKKK